MNAYGVDINPSDAGHEPVIFTPRMKITGYKITEPFVLITTEGKVIVDRDHESWSKDDGCVFILYREDQSLIGVASAEYMKEHYNEA